MNQTKKNSEPKIRYHLLDSIRGFAILSMIAFHLCYDLSAIYSLNADWYYQPLTAVWERSICITFISVSGMCLCLSSQGLKRGIIVNLAGFAVTAVTVIFMPSQTVLFGVLNLLGCSMMLLWTIKPRLLRVNPAVGLAVSTALYAFLYGVPEGFAGIFSMKLIELPRILYSCKYLAFLGLPSEEFFSTDYFPLVPWVFLFAAGFFFWRLIEKFGKTEIFKIKIPLMNTAGKYSLWIYLAHQPILMGALTAFNAWF